VGPSFQIDIAKTRHHSGFGFDTECCLCCTFQDLSDAYLTCATPLAATLAHAPMTFSVRLLQSSSYMPRFTVTESSRVSFERATQRYCSDRGCANEAFVGRFCCTEKITRLSRFPRRIPFTTTQLLHPVYHMCCCLAFCAHCLGS
jgi:hypothetical protein